MLTISCHRSITSASDSGGGKMFRKFSSDGSLSIYGRCRNGKLHGICWKFNSGGGALFGPVDCDGEMSGEDIVYL